MTNPMGSNLSFVRNQGKRVFVENQTRPAEGHPCGLAVGDLNGDGKLDVVAAMLDKPKVNVFLNRQGAFQDYDSYQLEKAPGDDPNSGVSGNAVTLGDIEGDGDLDLVADKRGYLNYGIFRNRGGGKFGLMEAHNVGRPAYQVTAAELNGDGRTDILLFAEFWFSVEMSNGKSETDYQRMATAKSLLGNMIATGDLNGDKSADVAHVLDDGVRVYLNGGGGKLAFSQDLKMPPGGSSLVRVDLNRDGKPDLVAKSGPLKFPGDGTVTVWINQGAGKFAWKGTYREQGYSPWLETADFDNDGWPDLALLDYDNNALQIWFNGGKW